ncbi:ABC transporter ATP-binding protein [Herbiconiux daphne]|uniref:ABC transporter ATP-binding protein n=1 Tax=Herbiconiux daphne TaxID=2970914 RepID=A0ABT2H6U1_9MICO|nr:ABC transporter ATP-binding protein [Herbiconiux daphne]MCS5735658.1 ABC transporter ATP-binding protein [Herbiconiux daphne]
MSNFALELTSLSIDFGDRRIIRGLDLELGTGEAFGIVGESGSGKSTVVSAVVHALPVSGRLVGGTVRVAGRPVAELDDSDLRRLRARHVAVVAQDPAASLNPSMIIRSQLLEVFRGRADVTPDEAARRVAAMLERLRLPSDSEFGRRYPHELSGGQQQRVLLAMALVREPELLILDEATTGLDALVERDVIGLVNELRRERGFALLVVSHDFGVVRALTERIGVLRDGSFVEVGPTERVLVKPSHPYTAQLLACAPTLTHHRRHNPLRPIDDPGISGGTTEPSATPAPNPPRTPAASPLVTVSGGGKAYRGRPVLHDVQLEIRVGETLGLVGESGSGKSTLAGLIAGITPADTGKLTLHGTPVRWPLRQRSAATIRSVQMVFQNPDSTLNPSHRIRRILTRAIRQLRSTTTPERALAEVGLDTGVLEDYPVRLSGGQKQRVAIARALVSEPSLLICDEAVSALDVSVQAGVLALLDRIQSTRAMSVLFISHDLRVVNYISDRIAVMFAGRLVECGPAADLIARPLHPYTRALLEAASVIDTINGPPALPPGREPWRERHASGEGDWVEEAPDHWVLRYAESRTDPDGRGDRHRAADTAEPDAVRPDSSPHPSQPPAEALSERTRS